MWPFKSKKFCGCECCKYKIKNNLKNVKSKLETLIMHVEFHQKVIEKYDEYTSNHTRLVNYNVGVRKNSMILWLIDEIIKELKT